MALMLVWPFFFISEILFVNQWLKALSNCLLLASFCANALKRRACTGRCFHNLGTQMNYLSCGVKISCLAVLDPTVSHCSGFFMLILFY